MILQRLAKNIRKQDWFAVSIEFVLVIVGVLIALQVDNWNDERNARHKELLLLDAMRAELADDLQNMRDGTGQRLEVVQRGKALIAHIDAKQPYDSALDAEFGLLYRTYTFVVNRAAYENLKAQGVDMITDSQLRHTIVSLYEEDYRHLDYIIEVEREIILDILRPHFLAHFRDLRFGLSATPVDYESLIENELFRNALDYRIEALRQADIPRFREIGAKIESVIEIIDLELDSSS